MARYENCASRGHGGNRGGDPATGEGTSFTTSWTDPGDKTATVSVGSCSVDIPVTVAEPQTVVSIQVGCGAAPTGPIGGVIPVCVTVWAICMTPGPPTLTLQPPGGGEGSDLGPPTLISSESGEDGSTTETWGWSWNTTGSDNGPWVVSAAAGGDESSQPVEIQNLIITDRTANPWLKWDPGDPFNCDLTLSYELTDAVPADTTVCVFIYSSAGGLLLRSACLQVPAPGSYQWLWDGKDDLDAQLPKGIYVYQLCALNDCPAYCDYAQDKAAALEIRDTAVQVTGCPDQAGNVAATVSYYLNMLEGSTTAHSAWVQVFNPDLTLQGTFSAPVEKGQNSVDIDFTAAQPGAYTFLVSAVESQELADEYEKDNVKRLALQQQGQVSLDTPPTFCVRLDSVVGAYGGGRIIPAADDPLVNTATVTYTLSPSEFVADSITVKIFRSDKEVVAYQQTYTSAPEIQGGQHSVLWHGEDNQTANEFVDPEDDPHWVQVFATKDGETIASNMLDIRADPWIVGVYIVSKQAGAGIPSDDSKVISGDPRVYAVVKAITKVRDQSQAHWYLGHDDDTYDYPTQANIGGAVRNLGRWKRSQPKGWSALTFWWYKIEPYSYHGMATPSEGQLTNNDPAHPLYDRYTNVVADEPNEGAWLGSNGLNGGTTEGDGYDIIEYKVPSVFDVYWGAAASTDVGTMRYRVRASYYRFPEIPPFVTPGRADPSTRSNLVWYGDEDCYDHGVTTDVHRVSIRSNNSVAMLSYIDAYRNVPWVYGSAGNQTEYFVGADCADLMVGAARAAGLTSIDYTNAQNLATNDAYTHDRLGFKVRRNSYDQWIRLDTGAEIFIHIGTGSGDARLGDLLLIDFGNDGSFTHTTAVYRDANGSGTLDLHDELVYMHTEGAGGDTDVDVHLGTVEDVVDRGDGFRVRYWP